MGIRLEVPECLVRSRFLRRFQVSVFSAECEGITGTALAVPALRTISDVLPSGAYVFVVQSVML
jgi:hypothetical protein